MSWMNTTAGKGVSARPVADTSINPLTARILSALVMMPLVLAAIYFGFPYFHALILVGVCILVWEWRRLVGGGSFTMDGLVLMVGLIGAVGAATYGQYFLSMTMLCFVAVIFFMSTAVKRLISKQQKHSPDIEGVAAPGRSMWLAVGAFYIGIPSLALIWLRGPVGVNAGPEIVFWLFFVVWAADIGAYAAGRLIGGPKLAPSISPNKTWAGLMGAVVSAAAIGVAASVILEIGGGIRLAIFSGLLGLVSQGGDLLESAVKRHFDVKDSSGLIPGHGGLLDRVDALLAAAVAAALIGLADGGSMLL